VICHFDRSDALRREVEKSAFGVLSEVEGSKNRFLDSLRSLGMTFSTKHNLISKGKAFKISDLRLTIDD
jgi:hypothetical protein